MNPGSKWAKSMNLENATDTLHRYGRCRYPVLLLLYSIDDEDKFRPYHFFLVLVVIRKPETLQRHLICSSLFVQAHQEACLGRIEVEFSKLRGQICRLLLHIFRDAQPMPKMKIFVP